MPPFAGRIAAFTSWDTFPYILNSKRSGILVNSGFDAVPGLDASPEIRFLNRLQAETPLWAEDTRPDAFTFEAALAYLKARKPRVLYLSFDETDAQGHAGRYDRLLVSANKVDGYVRTLWKIMQSMPEYRDKTTLILSTDHGRGDAPVEWKDHGEKTARSEYIWIGFLGPDTPALGEREHVAPVAQSQIAATLAALLGQDYCAAEPRAANPISEVINQPK
jgi:Type I phosphodiesterase / nucleotide pyrophosphatase